MEKLWRTDDLKVQVFYALLASYGIANITFLIAKYLFEKRVAITSDALLGLAKLDFFQEWKLKVSLEVPL